MTPLLTRTLSLFWLCIAVSLVPASSPSANGYASAAEPQLTDSLYNAHHPRLLFSTSELTGYYDKVRDGGPDDEAYDFIRLVTQYIYPGCDDECLMDGDFGLATIPNLGLAAYFENPVDTAAINIGRQATLYIANNYNVDSDVFYSSLRLRALALGYDLFFSTAPEADRELIRGEMIQYIDTLTISNNFGVYHYRPYLANKSVMIAASLGLAAIALDEESDPARLLNALNVAELNISHWINYQLDLDGAYNEGALYGAWSMRNLIYYFWARKLFDGVDASAIQKIRNMVNWFPYELIPEGEGRTNNLNDCAWSDQVLSRHNTYFDWAQTAWGSQLAYWLWDYTAGSNGWDWGLKSDKASTALWNLGLTGGSPENNLPPSFIWAGRGLYYYRSGWELGPGSEDILFSFYSGEFQGGHAQEDQGQFTLYAYGSKFAIDHGPGTVPKESEAHNIILIDGVGQHNAGSSIGTNGSIESYLLSGFCDYVLGDQTDAYTTYSVLNKYNYPFLGTDWSWGYDGGNPVNYAYRTVIAVHDTLLPPYFILIDDIEKDGLVSHQYEWRLHTLDGNTVNTAANPIQIAGGGATLDMHLISPPFDSVVTGVSIFPNLTDDPDAKVLSVTADEISPTFAFLLFPKNGVVPEPAVSYDHQPWGISLTLDWGGGLVDVFTRNTGGGSVSHTLPGVTARRPGPEENPRQRNGAAAAATLTTDAIYTVIRTDNGQLLNYLVIQANSFIYDDTTWVSSANGPVSCALTGGTISLDRYDCDFTLYGPGVTDMFYRTQRMYFYESGGYLTPDPTTGIEHRPAPREELTVAAFPNPFNPATTIVVDSPGREMINAAIFDLGGRQIRRLPIRELPPGISRLLWDGTNDRGQRAASGVYFLRLETPRFSKTLKLILVK